MQNSSTQKSSSTENSKEAVEITWSDALEQLLCEEAEKASGLSWLHSRSETLYSKLNNYWHIPCIVLSTITGAASVGSASLFPGQGVNTGIGIGFVSILVSVLGTINTYYKFAQKSEGHRIGSIQYAQVFRTIHIEMALPRDQRQQPKILLKTVKEDLKRLLENIPKIPEQIIAEYKKEIGIDPTSDHAHPDVTNGVHKVSVYNEPQASPIVLRPSIRFINTEI